MSHHQFIYALRSKYKYVSLLTSAERKVEVFSYPDKFHRNLLMSMTQYAKKKKKYMHKFIKYIK